MIRRKLLTGFLIVALSIGSAIPVFADSVDSKFAPNQYVQEQNAAKISKDKAKDIAIKKIKDTFNVDVQSKNLDNNIDFWPNDYKEESYTWYVSWSKYDEKQSINYSVSIDSNSGKVIGFNKGEYTYTDNQPQKPVISSAKAKEIAEEYINKINSNEFKNFKYVQEPVLGDYQPVNYSFRYVRVVNGVEFDRDFIYVEVDGVKGNVLSYGYNYGEDINFPSSDGIISAESAMDVFKKNIDMKLSYLSVYNEGDYPEIGEVKLVYNPEYKNGSIVDAKEGKMIDWGVAEVYSQQVKNKNITDSKKEEIFKTAKPVKKLDKDLSKDEAADLIKANIKEIYNKDVNVEFPDGDKTNNVNGKKIWFGQFGKKQDDGSIIDGGGVSIDASTGELIYAYKYEDNYHENEVFTPKLTWEQGYDKAIDVIGKYFPSKIKDIKTDLPSAEMSYDVDGKAIPVRYLNFYFPRISNGLEYHSNNISVTLDMKTGEIIGLECIWNDNVKLPTSNINISKEQASKTFFDSYSTKLIYTIINTSKDYKNPKYEVKLTYTLNPKDPASPVYSIDAYTGKAVDHNGR